MSNTAIGYIRVSTADQADNGVSLDAQRERLQAYATLAGLDLVQIVEDAGVSGGTPLCERPGGAEMLALIRKHKAAHIVALKLDRLFRDAEDALRQTKAWDKAGVGLHLVDVGGQTINTGTAMGRMFLTMMAGFAELERGMIAERTASAMAHKKSRREVYSRPVLGFQAVDGYLKPDDEEQLIVREIFAMREQGLSLRAIANDLNSRGIIGKRGGVYHASTIRAVLANSIHA
jgi:DNA invertase Pin-like site-specific DNA recombinase